MKLLEIYRKNPHIHNKRISELFSSEIKFIEDRFVQVFTFKSGLSEEMKKDLYEIFGVNGFRTK